jgi:hypothetical protein
MLVKQMVVMLVAWVDWMVENLANLLVDLMVENLVMMMDFLMVVMLAE